MERIWLIGKDFGMMLLLTIPRGLLNLRRVETPEKGKYDATLKETKVICF